MATSLNRITNRALLLASLGILLSITAGCELLSESSFQLADDSRLPEWISLPPGFSRANSSLTMTYYVLPWGRRAQFILKDKDNHEIEKIMGSMRCLEPFQLKKSSSDSASGYPLYEAITVNGKTEIIEHKKMEPIFFVTDDTTIRKTIETTGCS